ncbi:MAG: two-component system, chemotaxis family, CheB/CheR fusion protein [Solirubrobacteraceae bacterium]|nr:two-component system, chemotaxis family, CheB/CheR fusion protein [Solirubrobacteraceae bacterium]
MSDPGFEGLLEFLKRARGFDFTGYKRASLERRFARRMQMIGIKSYGDYLDYLEVHPDEFAELFNALLINVTSFFRDPDAWKVIREEVLPELLDRGEDEPLRIWSAGCASGQEAYSIAMTLAELLGPERYRERVKIYGTDVDEDALATARAAVYTAKEMESVPDGLRERYFEQSDSRFAFRQDLRRTVIFGRNDLLQDAPISRLDLLVCRNTLMYFTAETQTRILRHFHFALGPNAALMLGKSEMMLSHREAFRPVDLQQRIFRKDGRPPALQRRVAGLAGGDQLDLPLSEDERLSRDGALELAVLPQLIVSRAGLLTFANLTARTLFGIAIEDIGRPFSELELSYQPTELRAPVDEALRERRHVSVGRVTFQPVKGEPRRLEIAVTPLISNGATPLGVAIAFEDVTRFGVLEGELESNRRDLELAYEELQSTIDELETTNEELQSANEELQTTNEELQSTNEELETMNEELQSTNEELETINDELRERTSELNDVNDFLEAILSSLGLAVAVIDREQRVQMWNHRAEDLWGLRQHEAVDHHFLALDIGLPTERIAPALRMVLSGGAERQDVELEAVNRRGRPIVCRTSVMALAGSDGDGDGAAVRGAIVLMEDAPDGERIR